MSWLEKRILLRVQREGSAIKTTPDFTQSESLESLSGVVTFSPASRPAFAPNDDITVEWIDVASDIGRFQFAGRVSTLEVNSQPQDLGIPANDVLRRLDFVRKVDDGDYEMTGKDPDDVLKDVLDYVGITYDDADITHIAYPLGAQLDLFWRVDQAASVVVQELNFVFGMHLFVVGNGRVVWNHYDLAYDDAAGLYKTYTKGTSRTLWDARLTYGHPEEVQSRWKVTGPSIECGSQNACQCQVWAKARDTNPQTGSTHQHRPYQEISSDMIQSVPLAESIVRRYQRWFNRFSKHLQLQLLNDPNVHPTAKIRYRDHTTYMDVVTGDFCTVTSVDRQLYEMNVNAICGGPGDEGTVTSGVQKDCNRTESNTTAPGAYTEPDFGYPPVDDGLIFNDEFPTGIDEDQLPNLTDPYTGCTELDGMTGGSSFIGGDGYVSISALDDIKWRSSGASASALLHGTGIPPVYTIQELVLFGGGAVTLAFNETSPYAAKNLGNDFTVGTAPAFTLSFEVMFEWDGASLEVSFGAGGALIYPAPGTVYHGLSGDVFATALLDTENETAYLAGGLPEHTCDHPSVAKNNGGVRVGGGLAVGSWVPVTFSFDYTAPPMSTYYSGPDGGYVRDTTDCDPFGTFTPDPCTDLTHRLEIRGFTAVGSTFSDPSIRLRGLTVGHTTCTPNTNFEPDSLGAGGGEE